MPHGNSHNCFVLSGNILSPFKTIIIIPHVVRFVNRFLNIFLRNFSFFSYLILILVIFEILTLFFYKTERNSKPILPSFLNQNTDLLFNFTIRYLCQISQRGDQTPQISDAYSLMVLSLENLPDLAILMKHFLANAFLSE